MQRWEIKNGKKYGVVVVNEQTVYQTPGNSHTSRQASAELQYLSLTGDSSYKENAIRALNWATYMVDIDGKNRYPQDENCLTDGYGDYVRHYLRAFAAIPELAPEDENHILSSTSVIQYAEYIDSPYKRHKFGGQTEGNILIQYSTSNKKGREVIRLTNKPGKIIFNKIPAALSSNETVEGYQWKALSKGGLLVINRLMADEIVIVE